MRILYSGPITPWSTTEARLRAFRDLGHDVLVVDLNQHLAAEPAWLRKIELHACDGPGLRSYNRALVERARDLTADLIWLDTGAYVTRTTLVELRRSGAPIVSYNSDYLLFRSYSWRQYRPAAALYDVHVTTNAYNVPELRRHGARKVVMTCAAFDPDLHRPPEMSDAERGRFDADVTFLGHCEPAYLRALSALRSAGLRLRIWGAGWSRGAARRLMDSAIQDPPQLWGPDSIKAMAAARICVGLLSKWNRSQSTGRSYEVPAIGSFFLGERTREHEALYREGVEAEFFSSRDELVAKARYYLAHDAARAEVAAAGHRRRWASGGTHRDRMSEILAAI